MARADYSTERQAFIDAFYHEHGPCCAGCDFWHHLNSRAGMCHRYPKHVGPSANKPSPFGVEACSLGPVSQALTRRDDWCGEFRDTYDWKNRRLGGDR
jgi:hypothetical protein